MSGSNEVQSVMTTGKVGEIVPPAGNSPKRKRSHRHTPEQIHAMENIFRDCPHPDTRQRVEISRELGLDLLQVKFWFQNKRTHMKKKHDRNNKSNMKSENEKLVAENKMLRETLNNSRCPFCGHMTAHGDMSLGECHMRMENARLTEDINRISGIAANYVGQPMTNSVAAPYSSVIHAANIGYYD